jgi:hypothetical protein
MQLVVKKVGSGLGSRAGKNVGSTAQTLRDKLDFLQTNNVCIFQTFSTWLLFITRFFLKL